MARTCVLTASDTTPDSGQPVVITATFSNDSVAVSIVSVESLIAGQQALLAEQMAQALVGRMIAATGGSDTAIQFTVIPLSGQRSSIVVNVDLLVMLSDSTNINATGVDLTVSLPTLVG